MQFLKKSLLILFFITASLQGETFSPKEGDKGGYLALSKEQAISNTTYLYIKYGLEEFRKEGVSFVLLDLDTPGGEKIGRAHV